MGLIVIIIIIIIIIIRLKKKLKFNAFGNGNPMQLHQSRSYVNCTFYCHKLPEDYVL